MDHPVFRRMPRSNIDGCKNPKFELIQMKNDRLIAV